MVNCLSSSLEATPSEPPLVDKPKRPLSGYNLFFRDEREKLLQALPALPARNYPTKRKNGRDSHRKISFSDLARTVGARWKTLDASVKQEYEDVADRDRKVYYTAVQVWKEQQKALGLPTKMTRDKSKGSANKSHKVQTDECSEETRTAVRTVSVEDFEPLPFAQDVPFPSTVGSHNNGAFLVDPFMEDANTQDTVLRPNFFGNSHCVPVYDGLNLGFQQGYAESTFMNQGFVNIEGFRNGRNDEQNPHFIPSIPNSHPQRRYIASYQNLHQYS